MNLIAELHIVVIEDAVADVVLINHELRKGGLNFRITRVETKAEFLNEMDAKMPSCLHCEVDISPGAHDD